MKFATRLYRRARSTRAVTATVQRTYLNAFGIKYAVLICPHRNEAEFEAKLDELDGLLELCGCKAAKDWPEWQM